MQKFISRMVSSGLVLFAMPLILGVLIMGPKMAKAVWAKSWDQVDGRITACQRATNQQPYKFRYWYRYKGKQYESRRIVIGGMVKTENGGTVFEEYPLGTEVTVYVNPRNPEEAVLVPSFRLGPLWFFAIILVLMIRKAYKLMVSDEALLNDQIDSRRFDMESNGTKWDKVELEPALLRDSVSVRGGCYYGSMCLNVDEHRATVFDWYFALKGKGSFYVPYFQTVVVVESSIPDLAPFYLRPTVDYLEREFFDPNRVKPVQEQQLDEAFGRVLPQAFKSLYRRQLDARLSAQDRIVTNTELDFHYILESDLPAGPKRLFQSPFGRDVLGAVIQSRGWTVEWTGKYLIVFQLNQIICPLKLTKHFTEVFDLIRLLGEAAHATESALTEELIQAANGS